MSSDGSQGLSEGLDVAAGYSSAWNEIAVRIDLRQNAINLYVTLALAICGGALAGQGQWWRAVYILPVLGFVLAGLLAMHDQQIAILRAYLATVERRFGATIGYHVRNPFSTAAQRARISNDVVSAGLLLAADAYALYTMHQHQEPLLYRCISAAASIASVLWVALIGPVRVRTFNKLYREHSASGAERA